MRQYLKAKLTYDLDVLDVAEGLKRQDFVLLDTRKQSSWDHGHVPGAVHLPAEEIGEGLIDKFPEGSDLVVYGWSPGCNGGTKAALKLVDLGYRVREMLGGFEYWCREGLPYETAMGMRQYSSDPLVTAENRTASS
ncbi:hypothetical protein GCM10027562_28370 [Arthrobacter pigmenti]